MVRQLLVESIRVDGQTQCRERINEETVAEYAEAMKAPAAGAPPSGPRPAWPALVVFYDGTDYWLADGFHRLLAAKRVGRKNITADVKQGSREDAAWAACAANQTHGLRRTNADKRKAVEIALTLHSEMSDEAIGRHVGVSRDFVLRTRRERKPQGVIGLHPDRRTGTDGKSYSVPTKVTAAQGFGPPPKAEERRKDKGGPPPTPPAASAAPTAPSGDDVESHLPQAGGYEEGDGGDLGEGALPGDDGEESGAHARSRADATHDDMGRLVPEYAMAVWGRRREVQDLLTAISRVRVALRKAQETSDPLFSEIPFSSAQTHLDQAYDAVQVSKPYAVCAYCQGHGCQSCGERGMLGKFRWKLVPRELREAVALLIKKDGGK